MIKANFDTYNSYVTDSLYQWDLNQVLSVPGLNLATAPEVHFSNANMDKAIVRQATLTNGVVYADIPNSLLQDPLTVKAYIGIYEGATFKVIEEISIPVRPKERPADYRIESTDYEIYSFESLKNALENKADNARVNNIIANASNTGDNAELIDIRYGADGKTYESAGEAVRTPLKKLTRAKANIVDVNALKTIINYEYQFLDYDEQIAGEYWSEEEMKTTDGYYRYPVIEYISAGTYYYNNLSTNFTYIENVETGEFTKLSDIAPDGSITVDYMFNLYATNSYVGDKPTFSTSYLGNKYVNGAYDVNYSGVINGTPIFYCGKGEQFETLKEAIEYATQFMDSTLYVRRGEYDLISEFGASYFANYTTANGVGLVLKNRIHVIFEQGAKVLCNYTGSNENVHTYFSPFNSGEYGFTLENADIESSNVRYAIHDERASAEIPYKNIYKRCKVHHDSSNTVWGSHQALGGGLGCWGDIVIEDCHFSATNVTDVVTYHNAGYENEDLTEFASNIVIKDCYIDGTIGLNSTGYSSLETHAYVSNNSLSESVKNGKTTEDAKNNMIVHEWNNYIRT